MTRLESTMLLFNSLLVRDEGVLATIVPNSIINSIKQIELRKYLADRFDLQKIIKLPKNAFGKDDIKTSIIVLKKTKRKGNTMIFEANLRNGEYTQNPVCAISQLAISAGNWDVLSSKNCTETIPIQEFNIYRNNISSAMFKNNKTGVPIIHSSSINNNNVDHSKIKYVHTYSTSARTTKPGDIVVTRIGKKRGSFALITDAESNFLTSDCLFILRYPDFNDRNEALERLNDPEYWMKAEKGVAAKYITKQDIYKLMV